MSPSLTHPTPSDHFRFKETTDIELRPLYDSAQHDSDDNYDYEDDEDDEDYSREESGRRMSRSRRSGATSNTPGMNGSSSVEFRRKSNHHDGDTPSNHQAEALLGRESFSLDDDHDANKPASASLMALSSKDRRNFFLLVLLYFLQGVPMGLAMGSVPFLLKHKLSYGEIGVFTLASYPYSMKLLWSPIVDAIWSPKIGRRKSWIVPVQAVSAAMLLWLGGQAEKLMEEASEKLYFFTFVFFCLVMLCATQDVAVDGMSPTSSGSSAAWSDNDLNPRITLQPYRNGEIVPCDPMLIILRIGWALTLISPENLSFASTAQTVGLTAGQFLSYTVFLAFESPDFANKWFRKEPLPYGVFTLGGYLKFWGWVYLVVTIGLALIKKEEKTNNRDGIISVYKTMWKVLKLKRLSLPFPAHEHALILNRHPIIRHHPPYFQNRLPGQRRSYKSQADRQGLLTRRPGAHGAH